MSSILHTPEVASNERLPVADGVKKGILVADHDPVRRRLLELHLADLGFEVISATDGAEAIEKMNARRPDIVVSDVIMPRLDGFRLAQFIRHEPAFSTVPVILTTSGTLVCPGDEDMARNMGANAIVEHTNAYGPIVSAIRSALAEGPLKLTYDGERLEGQRNRFIADGLRDSRQLLNDLNNGFDISTARNLARRWAGAGGPLGLFQVSQAAYDVERYLDQDDPDVHAVWALVAELIGLFSVAARTANPAAISEIVATSLAGKRFAAVGFDEVEVLHLIESLEQAQAFVRSFDTWPDSIQQGSNLYDGLILNVRDDSYDNAICSLVAKSDLPLVAVGSSSASVEALLNAHSHEHDFVLRPWSPSEILLRCYTVTSRSAQLRLQSRSNPANVRARVLIGDDDPTTLALVQMTLKNYNMDCETASSGGQILETAARSNPDIVILDINMQQFDGFEVLAALKGSDRTKNIPVFVLTGRQQETDILRGFGLGAEDYITKPFSPMELVARIKRTLRRTT